MRGEDAETAEESGPTIETPPHAWGRPDMALNNEESPGNTPTCVGKTAVEEL